MENKKGTNQYNIYVVTDNIPQKELDFISHLNPNLMEVGS